MEQFIEWLQANWQTVALLGVGLTEIIILILKRAKVVKEDTVFEKVVLSLPNLIVEAEKTGKTGQEKWQDVIAAAYSMYAKLVGNPKNIPDDIIVRLNGAVENILSTPQKKEV